MPILARAINALNDVVAQAMSISVSLLTLRHGQADN